ncbi:unnamed protein product [Candida verbasci]|uniref:Major facilitator superfamily (MFS) profile domain-containing protein n=1 Tax=Candida verbasci TaxID=1227364 RepID=A0A9W4XEL4_9ASCO|nr:unnamed protein product [Candida verbasci]
MSTFKFKTPGNNDNNDNKLSKGDFRHLSPNIIHDTSAGTSGLIAGELAAEDDNLLNSQILTSHEYGSINSHQSLIPVTHEQQQEQQKQYQDEDILTYEIDEPNSGFALPKSQLFSVISSLFMASFLAALDGTIVTTILTLIASDLNVVSNISWIATAYLLSSSAFQPIFGKLSDIFGRKILLLGCSALFGIGCLICNTNSLVLLVVGRFITGCGGSGLTALGTITMSDMIPLRDRGFYQGLANVFFGIGSASGGIVGGYVSDILGWRYVFILQVPLSIILFITIYFNLNLPQGSPGLGAYDQNLKQKLKRVDFSGALLLVSSLMMILTAAALGGRDIEYNSKTFISLCVGSIILLTGFIYNELYLVEEPILPITLLSNRTILASSLANWFYTMAYFTVLFYIPIYYSSVMGMSATENGSRLIPNFFGTLGSIGAGLYMKKTGRYYKLAIAAGTSATFGILNMTRLGPETPIWEQFLLLLPTTLGYSCILTVTLLALIAAVPLKYQACTTSIQYTFRSTGSTLGVSIATAIFQNILFIQLNLKVKALIDDPQLASKIIQKALESTDYVKIAPKEVQNAIKDSYALGCQGAIKFALATIILGSISSLFMKEYKLHTSVDRK